MNGKFYLVGMMVLVSLFTFSKVWIPNPNIYLFLVDILITMFIGKYYVEQNVCFFDVIIYLFAANLFAYVVIAFDKGISLASCFSDIFTIGLLLVLLETLGGLRMWIRILKTPFPHREGESTLKLFKERKKDIKALSALIKENNIVGVCASWGDGKSFVVDHFYKKCARKNKDDEKYDVICINVLAYKYKEADRVLIERLDDILVRHGIFSVGSSELKNLLGHSFLGAISSTIFKYFGRGSSSSSVFESLKSDLEKLSNPVLIVFEDLERVGDVAYARQVLAMAHQMASDKCKIIFEYDKNGFIDLGLTPKYLEKFIPVEMPITRVSYHSMAHLFWKELRLKEVNFDVPSQGDIEITKNLKDILMNLDMLLFFDGEGLPNSLSDAKKYYMSQYIEPFFTSRKIKFFFEELKPFIQSRNLEQLTFRQIHAALMLFFVKHVRHDWYEQLDGSLPLIDMPLFTKPENLEEKEGILDLFGYKLPCAALGKYTSIEIRHKQVCVEVYNEEIDNMLAFLLGKRISYLTRLQNILNDYRKFLKSNSSDKEKNFEEWLNSLGHKNASGSSSTQCIESIVKTLYFYHGTREEWKKFVKLYRGSSYYKCEIDVLLLIILEWVSYACVGKENVFNAVLELFANAEVKYFDKNYPIYENYKESLYAALSKIVWYYGSCNEFGYNDDRLKKVKQFMNNFGRGENFTYEIRVLADLVKKLEEKVSNKQENIYMGSVIEFLNKNIEILGKYCNIIK